MVVGLFPDLEEARLERIRFDIQHGSSDGSDSLLIPQKCHKSEIESERLVEENLREGGDQVNRY